MQSSVQLNTNQNLKEGYEFDKFGIRKKDINKKYIEDILNVKTDSDNPDFDNKSMGVLSVESIKNRKFQDKLYLKNSCVDEIDIFKVDNLGSNVYTTINTVKGKRLDSNIQGLNAFYVDIDTTHEFNTDNLTHKEIMDNKQTKKDREYIQSTILDNGINAILYNNSKKMSLHGDLIEPSYTIFTGHGFLLVYLFKNQVTINDPKKNNSNIAKKWKYTEKYLCKQVQSAFDLAFNDLDTKNLVDIKATNLTRLTRLPGTTNWKGDPISTYVLSHSSKRYDFFELSRELTPINPRAKKEHKIRYKKSDFVNVNVNFQNFRAFNSSRIKDLIGILEYSKGMDFNGNSEGFREVALFYYSIIAGAVYKGENLLKELHHFNILFAAPLDVNQVNNVFNQHENTESMQINNQTFKNTKNDDKRRIIAPKNQTLLNLFGITPDIEVKLGLKTILSKTEKNRRRNVKNQTKSKKDGAKANRLKRDLNILEMYFKQEKSKKEISEEIGCTTRTVRNVIKKNI